MKTLLTGLRWLILPCPIFMLLLKGIFVTRRLLILKMALISSSKALYTNFAYANLSLSCDYLRKYTKTCANPSFLEKYQALKVVAPR